MNLIEYITLTLDKLRSEGKNSAAAKYSKLLGPLKIFLRKRGEEDIAINILLQNEFYDSFRTFLTEEYPTQQTQTTISGNNAEKHLKTLKTIERKAIKDGSLPNINLAASRKRSNSPRINAKDKPYTATFLKIARAYAHSIEKIEGKTNSNSSKQKIFERYLGLPLLAIVTGGMSIRELCLLPAKSYINGVIQLTSTGNYNIELSPTARFIIARHQTSCPGENDFLLNFVNANDSEEQIENNLRALNGIAKICFALLNIDEESFNNFLNFWILIAVENGVSTQLVSRRLIHLNNGTSGDGEEMQAALNKVSALCDNMFDGWFAVKCVGGKGEKISKMVIEEGLVAENDVYVPTQIKAHVKNGRTVYENVRILDNLFFFRATMARAEMVQKFLKLKGVIYGHTVNGQKEFAVIPESQIQNMRLFLGDYDPRRVIFDPDKQYAGTRVRVTDGLFKGCEGIIADVKTVNGEGGVQLVKYFIVQIRGVIAFATQKIEDGLLEEII